MGKAGYSVYLTFQQKTDSVNNCQVKQMFFVVVVASQPDISCCHNQNHNPSSQLQSC